MHIYNYAQKSPTLPRGMYIYMHTKPTLLSRVFLLTLHTAEGFVALISFYELRTSRITALNTMGAARLQREAAHAAAFLSRLANLRNREILVMRGYKIYKRLNRVTPSRSFVRSFAVRSRWLAKDTQ